MSHWFSIIFIVISVSFTTSSICNYVAYGGNKVNYYPVGQCWTSYYDSNNPELSSSYIWKCNEDGTNITYYYYNNSFNCNGEAQMLITFTTQHNYICNQVDCSIIIRKYIENDIDNNNIVYREFPYVSSTCFDYVYPGSAGYWTCDSFVVLEFFWLGSLECNFIDRNSYQIYTTRSSHNTTIRTCNML
eukprot:115290_1